jgi:hypothetical protein
LLEKIFNGSEVRSLEDKNLRLPGVTINFRIRAARSHNPTSAGLLEKIFDGSELRPVEVKDLRLKQVKVMIGTRSLEFRLTAH